MVLAGAGSGKTRVLTARIARLVEEGLPPYRILAVTFTNKAAEVMRGRIAALIGEEPEGLWAGTFHSVCARVLRIEADRTDRTSSFTIYDENDAERTIKRAMEEVGADPRRWSVGAIRARISDAKNVLVTPEEYAAAAKDPLSRTVGNVYPEYERLLARCNAYDFDDLLARAVRLLEGDEGVRERFGGRFAHVLVDEYQDTNHAQYRLVRAFASVHGNICVVGDDDQSIYGWRGADLRNILDFERDFSGTEVVRLEQNYRSTGWILEVANVVISRNRARVAKRLRTERPHGDRVLVAALRDERSEAQWTVRQIESLGARHALGEIGVLYRTNSQSRAYEDALRGAGMPYRVVGGIRFYERREVKDVLAYLQLAVNSADDTAFLRAVGWPRRGVGAVSLERLDAARARSGESLLAVSARAREVEGLPRSAADGLERLAAGIRALRDLLPSAPAAEVAEECLRAFRLRSALEKEEDGEDRLANVDELVAGMVSFERNGIPAEESTGTGLELFLQHVSLLTDIDQYDPQEGAVSLMTLHNAKGMEFPVVFIGGAEEGLLPLARSAETVEELEEERRLFYVGVTRAIDRLFITHVSRRWRAGSSVPCLPSSFLDDLPDDSVERRISGIAAGRRSGLSALAPSAASAWPAPSAWARSHEETGLSAVDYGWRYDPSEAGSGPVYDYTDSQEPLELTVGSRIVHPRFGQGTVISLTGDGQSAKARIEFDGQGRKTLVVAHAGLRPGP